jgi:Protein of unknown function (DUF4054)
MYPAPLITFDYALFQAQIPLYATSPVESVVEVYWGVATYYVSNIDRGVLNDGARAYAINLMTAHLIFVDALAAEGQVPGLMQNATVDKVTVGLTPPPLPDQWQWWLSLSPYGQKLLALLQALSVGGFFVSGPYGGIRGYNPTYGYGYGGSL